MRIMCSWNSDTVGVHQQDCTAMPQLASINRTQHLLPNSDTVRVRQSDAPRCLSAATVSIQQSQPSTFSKADPSCRRHSGVSVVFVLAIIQERVDNLIIWLELNK